MSAPNHARLSLAAPGDGPSLGPSTMADLVDQLSAARGPLVITGSAEGFCTGLDLGRIGNGSPEAIPDDLRLFSRLLAALAAWPWPTIAVAEGDALGGGLAIAAAADIVIAAPAARFGLSEVLWGLVPGVALPYVAARIGRARARLLSIGYPPVLAATALAWGLVDEVSDDLPASLERHLRRLARMDAAAVAEAKTLVGLLGPIAPQGYESEAISRFGALVASDQVARRVARFQAGEAPWAS